MHRTLVMRTTFISALLALLLLSSNLGVVAGQTPAATPVPSPDRVSKAFEFYPAGKAFGDFFDPTIKAGESVTLKATLGNTGEIRQDLRTYAVNAFTKDGGGFAAAEYGTAPNDVTKWLDYPEKVFSLEPGKGVERSFKINVPKGTAPGQYITAVAGEQAKSSEVQGSSAVQQKLRFVVPVFITVPGDTPSGFEIGSVAIASNPDALVVTIPIQNTGGIRVRPEGDVSISDQGGKLIATIPVKMESIYARESTTLTVGVPGAVAAGNYQVKVNLTDPDTKKSATAEVKDLPVQATGPNAKPAPITIGESTITPGPDAKNIQFVTVKTTISNSGDPVANAQLSLIATKDGKEVERFPISQSLSLPQGDTPVTARYLPATGWTSGKWTFEVLLETVDPSGAAVVVGRLPVDTVVTIP